MTTSADLIRATRATLGLSGDRFAAALGFAHGRSVRAWEAGAKAPPHVLAWCRALAEVPGLSAWLIARADEAKPLTRKRRPGSNPTGPAPRVQQVVEGVPPSSVPRSRTRFGAKTAAD